MNAHNDTKIKTKKETMATKKPIHHNGEKVEKKFEELPPKACKRRRLVATHHHPHTPVTKAVISTAESDALKVVDDVPPPPPPPPEMTVATIAPARMTMYHVPGGGTGVGIAPLDTASLSGSQRIGIIGLPDTLLAYGNKRRSQQGCLGTGKSTCCKSLLSDLAVNYPVISVFSGSEADNPFYSLCIPKLFIQTRITRKGLKQFINRQRLAISHNSPLKDSLLILDDCFESPSSLDNDMMRIIYKQGRHLRASVWCGQSAL
jgi:hypothetical protein